MNKIYFVTNRDPNRLSKPDNFGTTFSRAHPLDLRFGTAVMNDDGDIEVDTAEETLPTRDEVAEGETNAQLGSERILSAIRREMTGADGCDTVLYVHGFDHTFIESLETTFKLKQAYADQTLNWVVFSWPSNGERKPFRSYFDDRWDAEQSGNSLGRGMMKFAHYLRQINAANYCDRKVHIMAHSMGAYALRHAVQAVWRDSSGRIRKLFSQIILAAPDEDEDAFEKEHKYWPLDRFCDRITLYHHPGDAALNISDFTKRNPDRIGSNGPRNIMLAPDKLDVVNVKDVVRMGDDFLAHHYYYKVKRAVEDIIEVLRGADSESIMGRQTLQSSGKYKLINH